MACCSLSRASLASSLLRRSCLEPKARTGAYLRCDCLLVAHRDLASRIHVRNAAESGQNRTDVKTHRRRPGKVRSGPVRHPHASPTKASTKVAAASLSCLRPYPARSITASPLVKVTTTRASRFASIAGNLLGAEPIALPMSCSSRLSRLCTRWRTAVLEIAASSAVRVVRQPRGGEPLVIFAMITSNVLAEVLPTRVRRSGT